MGKSHSKMWLGTELYSGSRGIKYSQKDIDRIVDNCNQLGLNKIDTAECYGTDRTVEKMIGKAIKARRDQFVVSTKFGHRYDNGKKVDEYDVKSVEISLKRSLLALQTNYVDIYFFHSGSNSQFSNDGLWRFLEEMKNRGVIRHLGLSLKHSLVMDNDFFQIEKAAQYGITVVQTVLNLYSRHSLDYVVPFCREKGVKVIGRMPLSKGLISKKYRSGYVFDESDERSKEQHLNNEILKKYCNITAQEALEWCARRVDEVVIGSKNIHQLRENFSAISRN